MQLDTAGERSVWNYGDNTLTLVEPITGEYQFLATVTGHTMDISGYFNDQWYVRMAPPPEDGEPWPIPWNASTLRGTFKGSSGTFKIALESPGGASMGHVPPYGNKYGPLCNTVEDCGTGSLLITVWQVS
jgi:hypothetical protein